jgi:Lon protease-like protein
VPSFSIPLFPLSNVVLFPRCLAPLHIFELRYRQMTEAALEGERLIGMVTVRPDAREEMGGNPPIYAVGCAGFITDHQRLPDGRYNIVLRGVKRFRVENESAPDCERLYRLADARWLDDSDAGSADGRTGLREGVLGHLRRLARRSQGGEEVSLAELCELDDGAFTNSLCQAVGLPPEEKQGLLEAASLTERLTQLEGLLAFHLAGLDSSDPGGASTVH